LPFDRLTVPARPLQGAVADLEALLGHAVVLSDDTLLATWNVPEDFPAAVCVPVATSTTLLGTLWVYSKEKRDFNDRETNVLEVVAGRLATELERETLLRTSHDDAELQTQLAAAGRLQRNELPTIAPMLDGWDLAGWTAQADQLGGAFHDWFCLPGGLLAVAVGRAAQQGVAGGLTANALRTAIRCHARYHRQAAAVLPQVNMTLWTGSAGDRHAGLFFGFLETATGRVCCSSAGRPSVVLIRGDGWQSLSRSSTMLGESPEIDCQQFGCELQPGDALAMFTDSFHDAADDQGRLLGETGVAEALQGKLALPAAELAAIVQATLDAHAAGERRDRSILVVRRTTA
jgi:phosphoserine phosphatase RsbU/P